MRIIEAISVEKRPAHHDAAVWNGVQVAQQFEGQWPATKREIFSIFGEHVHVAVNNIGPAGLQRSPSGLDEIRLEDIVVEEEGDRIGASPYDAFVGADRRQPAIAVMPDIDDAVVTKCRLANRKLRSIR